MENFKYIFLHISHHKEVAKTHLGYNHKLSMFFRACQGKKKNYSLVRLLNMVKGLELFCMFPEGGSSLSELKLQRGRF